MTKLETLQKAMSISSDMHDMERKQALADYKQAVHEINILEAYQRLRFSRAYEGRPLKKFAE